ncbi:MAG: hypothetical protein IJM09_04540 [Neisseriaceae bacterium]|nr:hypothetical protein [Neisseriaceae bacterium]
MGYRVGNVCYSNHMDAQNAYFGAVVPIISNDGTLLRPVFNGSTWTLNGVVLDTSFPACDPAQNFRDGVELGWLFAGILAMAFGFTIIKRLVR